MRDGTPLGLHAALIDAHAAILVRHHALLAERPLRNVSGQTVPCYYLVLNRPLKASTRSSSGTGS